MPLDLLERAAERLNRDGSFRLLRAGLPPPPRDNRAGTTKGGKFPTQSGEGEPVAVDLIRLQRHGYVTPGGGRTRIAEEFRLIKRPLLLKALAGGADAPEQGNMIMVTSVAPGEGKTFTAVNLAMSVASERDVQVLLIDADVYKPSIMSTLGLSERKGLFDVLCGAEELSCAIVRTAVPNLSLMAAGARSLNSTELLAGHRAAAIMRELGSEHRNRVVIFDAPPVLAATEASALSLHVGQTVLIVEAARTPRRQIDEALNRLAYARELSVVLNKAPPRKGTMNLGIYSAAGSSAPSRTVR